MASLLCLPMRLTFISPIDKRQPKCHLAYKLMTIIQHRCWWLEQCGVCVCFVVCVHLSRVSVFAVMEQRDKRSVPDKRTEQNSGRMAHGSLVPTDGKHRSILTHPIYPCSIFHIGFMPVAAATPW